MAGNRRSTCSIAGPRATLCHDVVVRRHRWEGVPPTVRFIVGVEATVLAYGAVIHVIQLVGGDLRPYSWAPTWLAAYCTSLTLADPLAALLLWTRRRVGLYLGVSVLVTDAAANGYAVYCLPGGTATSRMAQVVIAALALAALITVPRVHPWLCPCSASRSAVRDG